MKNQTSVNEFILLGFSYGLQVQPLLYLVFLVTYMVTITENAIIIFVVKRNNHLQKPMYYFLGNLSFLEIWYVSVTLPRLLFGFWSQRMTMSFSSCMTQLYFFIALMCTECVLLAVMAYDRYLAVCHPLRYTAIMTHKLCFQLSILSWAGGFSISLVKVSFISRLSFCGPQVINHFFCDISPVLNLSCTDMSLAETVDFALALVILLLPLLVIVFSYCCILTTILCMPSAQGRRKAFSTCTSHFTVVIIFFSATLFMYARPRRIHPFNINKIVSVFYAVFTPALNPLIYCLRNKEVKEILRKIIMKSSQVLGLYLNLAGRSNSR
ncbi:olfactory receptor 6B1-like [Egretta garzetta]|uniref:olfactory receptor 6B1-like n=1 Tax=Egretta garzetta TaxID=188379 RepID=UPI00051EF2FC|nr:olfactory receptor 6B1-like [Egretta garzetta]